MGKGRSLGHEVTFPQNPGHCHLQSLTFPLKVSNCWEFWESPRQASSGWVPQGAEAGGRVPKSSSGMRKWAARGAGGAESWVLGEEGMGAGVPVTQTEMKLGHPDLGKEWVMGGRGMSLSPGRPRDPPRRNGRIRLGGVGRGQAADTSKPARLPAPSPLISGSTSGCAALQKPPSLLPARITPSRWRSLPQGRYRRPGSTPHTHAGAPPGAGRGLGEGGATPGLLWKSGRLGGPWLWDAGVAAGRVDGWGDPASGILELPLEEWTAWEGP